MPRSPQEKNQGSPPRMRGKPTHTRQKARNVGITPADAGKTHIPLVFRDLCKDHPRGCGENRLFCGQYALKSGSPPRMRGKHTVYFMSSGKPRITPAGAGKTVGVEEKIALHKDHPRRCGENSILAFSAMVASGSPPQVRGKRGIYHSLHRGD